jgi:hypothetical protein
MSGQEILTVLIWLLLCGGIGVGMYFWASKQWDKHWGKLLETRQRSSAADIEELRLKDRAEARAAYERVILAKLEVMKTAVAMGYEDAQLKALDKRLEGLIGADKVAGLVDPVASQALPSADMLDTDLERERVRLREITGSASTK